MVRLPFMFWHIEKRAGKACLEKWEAGKKVSRMAKWLALQARDRY